MLVEEDKKRKDLLYSNVSVVKHETFSYKKSRLIFPFTIP